MSNFIYSNPQILSTIKKLQFRQQMPPLALLILGFLIGFVIPVLDLRYVSLIICLVAIGWYLYVGACHRFRNRIPLPESADLLSPVTGRIKHVKSALDTYQLLISKSALDTVEIRCPHSQCQWDEDRLKLEFKGYNLIFRFDAAKLVKLDDSEMKPGEVIALFIGGGSCQIILPKELPCTLPGRTLCEAGVTPLISA